MALSVQEKILVEQRVTNEAKSIVLAYLFWFFVPLGVHRLYLGKVLSGLLLRKSKSGELLRVAEGRYLMRADVLRRCRRPPTPRPQRLTVWRHRRSARFLKVDRA